MKFNISPKLIIGIIVFTAFYFSMPVVNAEEIKESEITVQSFSPRDQNGGVADFLITLSQSIVDDNLLFTELPKNAIQVTPAVEGKARWMARNQIGFFLDSALAPSIDYTFELSTKLNPSSDFVLSGQRKFIHSTAPFKVEHAEIGFQYDKDLKKAKAVGTVTFNYPVSIAGLVKYLTIKTENGTEIPYTFQKQNAITKTIIIKIENVSRLLEGQYFQVQIKKGFKCPGTQIGLKKTSVTEIVLKQSKELQVTRADVQQINGVLYINLGNK
ncbi:hypothetical protein C6501_01325 [Candidatus Poribacteria bacterium]|nr:MAG: hypothetical protein C6501_01325 [Candidatus Poribacteria bacterium]